MGCFCVCVCVCWNSQVIFSSAEYYRVLCTRVQCTHEDVQKVLQNAFEVFQHARTPPQAAGMLPIGKVGAWCTNPSVSWPESIAFETQDGQMNGAKVCFAIRLIFRVAVGYCSGVAVGPWRVVMHDGS